MAPPDPVTQMNTYKSYVTMLADPVSKDELKLKAAQELSENFEVSIRPYTVKLHTFSFFSFFFFKKKSRSTSFYSWPR